MSAVCTYIHAAGKVLWTSFSLFFPLHFYQHYCLAMSSSDDTVRPLNLSAANSHALMEVISEYFAESDVDPEMDEEDASAEGKQ